MKYNDGQSHQDIYDKEHDELVTIAKEFSEGSKVLEDCLLTMWNQGLFTAACCKGDHDPFNNINCEYVDGFAYIAGADKIDFFSYLSPELINNEMVILNDDGNYQDIQFYGSDKEELIAKFTKDILTGKKNNKVYLSKKIGRKIKVENRQKAFIYHMLVNGYKKEDVDRMLPISQFIFKIEDHWQTYNLFSKRKIMKEYYESIGQLANMIYCAHEKLPITNDDSLTFSNKRL